MKMLIWDMRNKRGMSLRMLADDTGLSKSSLNDYENDKISPTIAELEQIAEALHCKIIDLFDSPYK